MTAPAHIHILLPFPPSVNHYWVRQEKGYRISDAGTKYRQRAIQLCQRARDEGLIPDTVLTGHLSVTIAFRKSRERKQDLDNLGKAILDSLTHAKVWQDDSQIHDLRMYWDGIGDGGGAWVVITEITKKEKP